MSNFEHDKRDRQLLAILEQNARTSVSELARQVALSATAVRQRMDKLERDGTIKGYTIRTDKLTDDDVIKVVLTLTLTGSHCRALKAEFGHLHEIRKFWSLTGETDAILIIEVPAMDRLQQIITMFSAHALISRVQSNIIIETQIDR